MTKETLKALRIIVPGVISIVLIYPLFMRELTVQSMLDVSCAVSIVGGLTLGAFLGGLYYILNLRRPFIKRPTTDIQGNIKTQLLQMCDDDTSTEGERLREGRTLMHIFYDLVDNDASLTEKAKSVRLNGLMWSSSADAMAISLIASAIFTIAACFSSRAHYSYWAVLCLVTFIFANVSLLTLTKRHIDLSNQQLELIRLKYASEVSKKIAAAAKGTRDA